MRYLSTTEEDPFCCLIFTISRSSDGLYFSDVFPKTRLGLGSGVASQGEIEVVSAEIAGVDKSNGGMPDVATDKSDSKETLLFEALGDFVFVTFDV